MLFSILCYLRPHLLLRGGCVSKMCSLFSYQKQFPTILLRYWFSAVSKPDVPQTGCGLGLCNAWIFVSAIRALSVLPVQIRERDLRTVADMQY